MSKKWVTVIILSVLTVVLWSSFEIYKMVKTEKDVGQYSVLVEPIPANLDTDLLKGMSNVQYKVLVKDSDIAPKTNLQ